MASKKSSHRQAADDPRKELKRRLASVAQSPGVYRWLDKDGEVLYVGKAKNLKHRLSQYLQDGQKLSAWKEIMVRSARDFDVTLTNSELEAYILETNLIKELRPKYNIMMKDDKNYVYVRISTDTYPRIDVVRRMEDDGATYFGPKTSAEDVRASLTLLRKLFPFRTCKMSIEVRALRDGTRDTGDERRDVSDEKHPRSKIKIDVVCKNRDRTTPCLDYHIKQCSAPCVGYVTPEEYRSTSIDGVVAFFEGKHGGIVGLLKEQMARAASDKKFERAAELRDQLQYVERLQEKQIISDTSRENADIFGVALSNGRAHIVLLKERDGRLIAEESFALQGYAETPGDALDQFLPQYYGETKDLPDVIILSDEPSERDVLRAWLSMQRGKSIELRVPQRGKKSHLLLLAEKNALWKAKQGESKWEARGQEVERALAELTEMLGLASTPKRIEGYDISHLGGSFTVGSMVVMIDGKPRNDQYRSFSIRTLGDQQVDDYAALKEVLRRRLRHLTSDLKEAERAWKERGVTFGKGRKEEQKTIESIFDAHAHELSYREIVTKDFLVARYEGKIVAFARFVSRFPGVCEIKSLWVDGKWRGKRLGQFLARKLLATVKKGKIYVTCPPALQEYYAEIGFRHVQNPPEPLAKITSDPEMPGIVMVYIASQNKKDVSLTSRPDLLIIDGGKGQLGAAMEALRESGLEIAIASLAKREEDIFIPNAQNPIALSKDAPAQFLLQRLRDEAHRFANELRKKQGKAAMLHSGLDDIPGVGPKTRAMLMKKFGSMERMREASDGDLLPFMTKAQIGAMREHFKNSDRR